jgi:hypothetical protein
MRCFQNLSVRATLCMALMLAAGSVARADNGISITISGYGTVGGTYTGNSAYTYIPNSSDFRATNSQFDLGLDSRIGVQATFTYGSDLSVIVQEEAKRRGSENFSPGTEWAFFQYAPTAGLKLRLGRVALATFLMSDSRDVGYAQPWFLAPNEVYGAEPYQTLDGGQALWHVNLGQIGLDLVGAYGTSSQVLETGPNATSNTFSAKYAYNLAAILTYDSFLLRVADTTVALPTSFPLGPTTVVSYLNNDKFLSVGFQYDNGTAIVLTEWSKRSENKAPFVNLPVIISSQWYAAGGWRFGKLTALLIYGKWDAGLCLVTPQVTTGTWSESLRYDIVGNVALKAQFSRPQVSSEFYWTAPNYASNKRVNVFSLGVDFVF